MQGAQLCQPVPGSRAMRAKLFTWLFLGTAMGEGEPSGADSEAWPGSPSSEGRPGEG